MKRYLHQLVLFGCVQAILITGYAVADDDTIAEIIRSKVEKIRTERLLQIDDARIASITVLPELYENNGFQRLWTNPQHVEDLFNAIKTIDGDGLHPDDYHFRKIENPRSQIGTGESSDPVLVADSD